MERYESPKARVAVGGFQVKAAGATLEIGDGLREMLVTALFSADRSIVLERQAIQDVLIEQDMGACGRVKKQTAAPIGRLEGAELMIYGVVSEFQSGSSRVSIGFSMSNLPLGAGGGRTTMPIGLKAYQNTPMEKAIRVCIEKAVWVIVSKTPTQYFHHQ